MPIRVAPWVASTATVTNVRPTPAFVVAPPNKSVPKPHQVTSTTTHLVPVDVKTVTVTNVLLEPIVAQEMTRSTVTW